ncbi:S41 family peptidase [Gaetbulibacter sp. M235]|uniref:S41 family peptidase n=1 Tax=Gaetbulibacter sp. M235 TaxID=3126510 RepID=UPI00374FC707
MKKALFLLFIISITLSSCGQTDSVYNDKLATTAKIWGFLKYYHPEVGKGKFNWDDQLFQILPKIAQAKNKQELSNIYLKWINSLGEIEICKECTSKENKDYFGKNFDLTWIKDSTVFSNELISKLTFIEKNRFQGNNHYVSSFSGVGNIKIQNEPEYPDFSWENEQLRLLSLFRYWNYIEYFFPYKYQMDKDWDMVLKESIPNFSNPKSETDYHLAMLELIVNINDSHGYFSSNLINDHFGSNFIPAKFQIIDKKAIITGFYNERLAKENDLQIGDVILKVDGKKIETILNENYKYINGSNASVKLRNANARVFNGSTNSVKITFERNNKIQEKRIQRYPFYQLNFKIYHKYTYENPIEEKYKILTQNIGYVDMGKVEIEDVSVIMDSLINTKAIIFDIRNYPKGTMYSIINYITSKKNAFYKVTYPDLNYPGKFIWREGNQFGKNGKLVYKGKVILLVNEKTQSHAEFTTMCLQTGENVTTIGSQTSGADGNVSSIEMVGGYKTAISGIGIFYPDNTETQRKGVKIDIEIKPTIQGIIDGKDEVLEKAIEYINN